MTEVEFLRDQVHRLNDIVARYQQLYPSTSRISESSVGHEGQQPWFTDESIMSPLLKEYDGSIHDLNNLLGSSRDDMASMRREMALMSAENNRLVDEVKTLVRTLPSTSDAMLSESDQQLEDDVIIQNLRKQLRSALDEKDSALEMWQTASKEVERLQSEVQKMKKSQSWKAVEERANEVENQYLQAVNQIEADLKSTHDDLRSTKNELAHATQEVVKQREIIESLREQLVYKEKELNDLLSGGDSVQSKISEYQNYIKMLETRLTTSNTDLSDLKAEQSAWNQKMSEIKAKMVEMEKKELDTQERVRESVNVIESALLERDQAIQVARQKEDDYEKLEKTVSKLMNDEGARTRKEVDNVRDQGNSNIQKLMDEMHALEMAAMEKDSKFERMTREKQAILSTLDQVTKDGKSQTEESKQLIRDLSQRLLDTERARDEANVKLETLSHTKRLQDIDLKQENLKKEEIITQLNHRLAERDEEFEVLNEEREKLLKEADVLRAKVQTAESERLAAIRKCTKELSISEQDQSLKVQELKAKLMATEDNHRHAMAETRKLLTAQQKMSARWKEECHSLTHKLEITINDQREEIQDLKRRNSELTSLLNESRHKTMQAEKMIAQYSRRFQHLEERVEDAEYLSNARNLHSPGCIWSRHKDSILRSLNNSLSGECNLSNNALPVSDLHRSASPLPQQISDLNQSRCKSPHSIGSNR